ncbi:hypothetical protein FCM73_03510 [Mycoplasma bovis]|nr:hypothetical protein [Mycoplasmopsis bovis]
MMIASDVKKYGKFDVYDPNKIVGKTDAEPFRSDYISIVKDGDAGRIRLLPKNTMILSTMGALIAKDPFKIDFLYYMLNAINDLARERNGSIIPHIYFKDYGQNIYNLPSIPEQSKISSLFTRLDSLITLHQRKLLSLKNLKSRLLDRMFCDEKSQFPSIRFKEFTNAWEQEKLGNLTILNRFPQISAQRLWELNQYFGEVFLLPSSDNNNWKCKYSKEIANLINTGEVITIGRARNPNVKYVNGAFISSQNHIIESKTTDALLNKFLYLFITKVGKKFYGFESTYPMFTKIDFLNTKFSFPIVSEQIKIIKTIDILDFLITLHQRKLNSLKNIKNTLLNKMFV